MTKEKEFLPGEIKELRILGRTGKSRNPLVLFWTASGFEVNYEGTELWCEFESDYSCYEQWIAVIVNGALISRQMLQKGRQRVCLLRNMQTRSFPYFVAEKLNAEYRVFSQSGYGVYCAYDNNLNHAMPLYYEQVCGVLSGEHNEMLGAKESYDFSSWQPDYIVINLGTNDGGAFHNPEWCDDATGRKNKMYEGADGLPAAECLQKVQKAVKEFLATVRKNNPNAQILWAYGMMGTVVEEAIKEGIAEYRKDSADGKVHYIHLEEIKGEHIGARSHPGVEGHKATAESIYRAICAYR